MCALFSPESFTRCGSEEVKGPRSKLDYPVACQEKFMHVPVITPSTGFRHSSSNVCHDWLCHRFPKPDSQLLTSFRWCSIGSKFVRDTTEIV